MAIGVWLRKCWKARNGRVVKVMGCDAINALLNDRKTMEGDLTKETRKSRKKKRGKKLE